MFWVLVLSVTEGSSKGDNNTGSIAEIRGSDRVGFNGTNTNLLMFKGLRCELGLK